MPLQTINVASGEHYAVTVTVNAPANPLPGDTAEIKTLTWTIDAGTGTLHVEIDQTAKPPVVQDLTASGQTGVPAGYFMTWNPKGAWVWDSAANGLSYTDRWIPA